MSAIALDRYDDVCAPLRALGPRLVGLIEDLLLEQNLRCHSVNHRVKERASLERKVSGQDKSYAAIEDVTDLLGIRIVTYFPDEVDLVGQVLETEFAFEPENSVDRRILLDPDRMGYLSLHYVGHISPERRELARFFGCTFEIQIRSILQHAWAEIEHDLGYKSEAAVPREVRRRFYRLAALLEIADDEFQSIREDLNAYAARIQGEVASAPSTVAIDQDSVAAFLNSSKLVLAADQVLANITGRPLADEATSDYAGRLAARARALDFRTIADIEEALSSRHDLISAWLRAWNDIQAFGSYDGRATPRGIGFWHALYAIAAERGQDSIDAFVSAAKLNPDLGDRLAIVYRKALELMADAPG